MHHDGTSGNRQPQTGSLDLGGVRFVYPIESLEDMVDGFLRNTTAGIGYRHIKILVIRVQRYTHPAFVLIVFDRIFHQIADGKGQFCLIDLRIHRPEAFQDQFDISLRRDRPQPF